MAPIVEYDTLIEGLRVQRLRKPPRAVILHRPKERPLALSPRSQYRLRMSFGVVFASIWVQFDELVPQGPKRPVVVSFRRVRAGRGDGEHFVFSCSLFWLSGTGRIVECSFESSLAIPFAYVFRRCFCEHE